MKQIIRIGALVLALLMLAGCSNQTNSERNDKTNSDRETTMDTADPVAAADTDPTAATTAPTVSPTETTAPATTAPTATEPPAAPITPASSAGYGAVYADICCLLDTGNLDLDYKYATIGMKEVVGPKSTITERYSSITYALDDINNDGSREMIVLDAMGNTRILAIFALRNDQPVMTHEGWYRSRLYKLSDGTLYSEGSGGAAYAIFEVGSQCWFTYPKEENQMEIGFYYAADGKYDPAAAQEITADEYNAKQTEFAQMITAFSVYNFSK